MKLTAKQEQNFWDKVMVCGPDDCWEWLASVNCRSGYGQVRLRGGERAHRISFLIEHGYLPEFVLHTCDNKTCVNPKHLYDGTSSQNAIDRIQRGPHNTRKLTSDAVQEIRYLLAIDLPHVSIAERFGVCRQTIGAISTDINWSHI